jgi:1-acyl-sn-glycerol-3-phosphate acyltransferase
MQTSTMILVVLIISLLVGYFWLMRVAEAANVADWGNKTANRIDGLTRLFMHKYHRLPGVFIDLPAEGPAIVVANHISGLDALMLLASTSRPLHFLIAQEQYNRRGFRWLFDLAECIPVEKTTRPDRALRAALHALEDGKVIALFPFGRMHLDSEPDIKIKGGVAVLAARSGASIYPARIESTAVKKEVMQAVIKRGQPELFPLEPIRIDENESPREVLFRLSNMLRKPINEAS